MKKIFSFIFLILCCIPTSYGDGIIRGAKILVIGTQDGIDSSESDIIWLDLDKAVESTSCHSYNLNRVAFDVSKEISKSSLSIALVAYATGRTVDVDTYSTCVSVYSAVRNIYLTPNQ